MRWCATALVLVLVLASLPAGAQDRDLARARMVRNGTGGAPDPARAARLFEQAARRGNADAAFTLSNMLRAGEGVPRDVAASRRWLEIAAEGESPEALQQLGMEEADPARAAQLFRQAAHALTHQDRIRIIKAPGRTGRGAGPGGAPAASGTGARLP